MMLTGNRLLIALCILTVVTLLVVLLTLIIIVIYFILITFRALVPMDDLVNVVQLQGGRAGGRTISDREMCSALALCHSVTGHGEVHIASATVVLLLEKD